MTITIDDILQRGVGLTSKLGRAFVKDFADSASAGAFKELRAKYAISSADWAKVPQNETLLLKVKAERDRRSRVKKPSKTKSGNKDKAVKPEPATNIVNLIPDPIQALMQDASFITDLARFKENLLTEKFVRTKYGKLDDTSWVRLAENEELISRIEEESVRRMRNGSSKREKSQMHVMRAPDVAAKIMLDESANNRHRLDACRVLDDFSATGPTAVPPADMFHIVINLGSDTLEYRKPIKPGVEIDPNEITPDIDNGVMAAIAMKPTEDGGGGEPI